MTARRSPRAAITAAAWGLSLVVAAGAAWWAAQATFRPASPAASAAPAATVEVSEVTVGTAAQMTAKAVWPVVGRAPVGSTGVVTSVDLAAGALVERGARLFSVDLRPSQAAVGDVPSFRDLAAGARGADVAQLERFLHDGGWLPSAPDDEFRAPTTQAVRAWQASLGVEKTGVVGIGDLVYFPTLPARAALEEAIDVGARVTAGDPAVHVFAGAPRLTLTIGTDIQASPSTGQSVLVHLPSGDLDAVVADATTDEAGTATVSLTTPEGGVPCPDPCDAIAFAAGEQLFRATVILAPDVTGPGVPLSALWTSPAGGVQVSMAGGQPRAVTVLASDRSRAILEGVDIGDVVQLFADPATVDGPAASPSVSGDA